VKVASQILKYLIVAVLAAGSDWVIFASLMTMFGSPTAAQAVSRIVGGITSFSINKYWSFRSRELAQTLIEGPRFVALFIVSYLISLSLISLLTYVLISPYWAKLATDTICFFFNFGMMRFWVYRQSTHAESPKASLKPLSSVH